MSRKLRKHTHTGQIFGRLNLTPLDTYVKGLEKKS